MAKTNTRALAVDPHEPDVGPVEEAAQVLRAGGLVVVPTDTVYGLVCDPGRPEAVDRIYVAKGRRRDLPLSLLLEHQGQVSEYVHSVPEAAVRAMQQFWPGALTVVLGSCKETVQPVCAGLESVGLRLPAHLVPRAVAGRAGFALASTSANKSGHLSPRTAQEALADLEGVVELVLDAGPAPLGAESTVVSFVSDPPRVLREAAIPLARLRDALGAVEMAG